MKKCSSSLAVMGMQIKITATVFTPFAVPTRAAKLKFDDTKC